MSATLYSLSIDAQAIPEPQIVDYCEVVTLPSNFEGKVLSVEAILVPGEHSLSLFGLTCLQLGYNRITAAILPSDWLSLRNAKKLSKILQHHHSAKVNVVGMFESDKGPYGPDGDRFQFTISEIRSVSMLSN